MLQLTKATQIISDQSKMGWFVVDIFSSSDNNNPEFVQNGSLEIQFSKLDGSGISKWVFVSREGSFASTGELGCKYKIWTTGQVDKLKTCSKRVSLIT
ncbi:hypothetical protein HC766_01970 [Candidatus Gracilibacteria bacterium]|nr:hypothetical protein [Candidatus Gracilibacteria bacterium]